MNLTIKKEKIQFGETKIFGIIKKAIKFWVVADIPDSMLEDYAVISKLKPDDNNASEQKKAFDIMKKVIISMLSVYNNPKKITKFVNKLGIQGTNKIFVFLNEYANTVKAEKKND